MILIVLPLLVLLGGLAWWYAVQSRRTYACPACGHSVTVELMSASRCNICGAELREVES